jgi:RNA polymerase sigma-70 factor (ECF subfamily)
MTDHTFLSNTGELQGLLQSFALRLTKDRAAAEDLIQDTYFRAYKSRASFQDGTNFKSWVTTIMHHAFINDCRRKKVRRHINAQMPELWNLPDGGRGVDNNGEASLRYAELKALVERLPKMYSTPFMMFYRGFEYREIATHLRLPIGTVKSRIFVARAKLKEVIGVRDLR